MRLFAALATVPTQCLIRLSSRRTWLCRGSRSKPKPLVYPGHSVEGVKKDQNTATHSALSLSGDGSTGRDKPNILLSWESVFLSRWQQCVSSKYRTEPNGTGNSHGVKPRFWLD